MTVDRDKPKDLKEITEEQKANQKKNYEARINSDFLDFKVATKSIVLNVPDRDMVEGYQPITLTILYNPDNGEGETIKIAGKHKLKEEHMAYLGRQHRKILNV